MHTAQGHFVVLHGVHAQQHRPKPRVELGHWLQVVQTAVQTRAGQAAGADCCSGSINCSPELSVPPKHHSCRCSSPPPFVTLRLCHIVDAVQASMT
jgi:hypothetical protein